MKRIMFTVFAVGLGLTACLWAQVPSYVPTNGLVGWWPFNGNANDESGNGNNGTVYGATLTTDRFGNADKAYFFSGINCETRIEANVNTNSINNSNEYTISIWVIKNGEGCMIHPRILEFYSTSNGALQFNWDIANGEQNSLMVETINNSGLYQSASFLNLNWANNWNNIVFTAKNGEANLYLNGNLMNSFAFQGDPSLTSNVSFGRMNHPAYNTMNGILDDIALWDRALTQQEITALYNGCGNEITSQPINANINTGSNAQFTIGAVTGSTYQWQNKPLNNGWQNVVNNSTYSGATTNTLTVANTSISNHNQPFRAIVNAGGCIDTSDVANIIIGDTCITNITVYDTLLTTVTDTLIINTTLSLPAPNNENTILIYPNPASDHITIDNGNFAAMAGYSIKIENNAGQQVFQSAINQAQFYVDLSTWTGNGLYFVHLIDPQNNTVTVRKIVLQ